MTRLHHWITSAALSRIHSAALSRIHSAALRWLRYAALRVDLLGRPVTLAPSSCLERVRRLQESGVITGFRADVNPAAVGIRLQAFVLVRLEQHSRDLVESFRDHVVSLPEVVGVYHVAGQEDFVVHVAVRDAEHLRNLTLDDFTTRTEVSRLNTALVYEHFAQPVWPNYVLED